MSSWLSAAEVKEASAKENALPISRRNVCQLSKLLQELVKFFDVPAAMPGWAARNRALAQTLTERIKAGGWTRPRKRGRDSHLTRESHAWHEGLPAPRLAWDASAVLCKAQSSTDCRVSAMYAAAQAAPTKTRPQQWTLSPASAPGCSRSS